MDLDDADASAGSGSDGDWCGSAWDAPPEDFIRSQESFSFGAGTMGGVQHARRQPVTGAVAGMPEPSSCADLGTCEPNARPGMMGLGAPSTPRAEPRTVEGSSPSSSPGTPASKNANTNGSCPVAR